MEELFLKLVNMSFGASIMILAVLVFRFLLRKNHRVWCRFLWLLVAIRLLCPVSLESAFSLIPSAEPIPQEILTENSFQINTQIPVVDEPINEYLGDHYYEGVTVPANQGSHVLFILSCIWIAGITILLLYGVITYFNLKHHLLDAVRFSPEECAIGCDISYKISNVWQSSYVTSPFILGIIRPRIYLPFSLKEPELGYVLAHEKTHIRHLDHLIKPFGFVILSVYWFNPLCWLAYILLCRDVELACDERTIRNMSPEEKKAYSTSLFGLSKKGHLITACPVAFGEVGVKERIKAVLSYKKPAFWTILAGVVACIVVAVCFLTNPKETGNLPNASSNTQGTDETDSENDAASNTNAVDTPDADLQFIDDVPAMKVVYEEQKISAFTGSYSKYVKEKNGQESVLMVDCSHPLDLSYENTAITLLPDTKLHEIEFLFPVMPDELRVVGYWSASNLGKPSNEWEPQIPYQTLTNFTDINYMVAQDDGDYIYEVEASWNREEFHGTVYYSFMTESPLKAEQSMMRPKEDVAPLLAANQITAIEITQSIDGKHWNSFVLDSADTFGEFINLYTSLALRPADNSVTKKGGHSYNYALYLYDSQGNQVQSLIPYENGMQLDDNFYPCSDQSCEDFKRYVEISLDSETVRMHFEKYRTTGGDVEIGNFSGKELQCGEEYYLMVYRDGNLEKLEPTADGIWNDIAYILPQGEGRILQTDFTSLYGTLESGKYRIVKPVMDWRAPGDYTEYELYYDFTIG